MTMMQVAKENIYTNREIENMFGIGSRTFRKITKDVIRVKISANIEFEKYKKVVRRITSVVKNIFDINPGLGFHTDHKLSVYDGFKLGVPPYLIASFENLEIIKSIDNLKKGSSSSVTKDELYRAMGII